MSSRILCLAVIVVGVFSICMSAQTAPAAPAPQAAKPNIKHVPSSYTNPSSGKEVFDAYCASCYGKDGKGDGPAAPALKTPATNLTTPAANYGGTFPATHISEMIQGDSTVPPTAAKTCPCGPSLYVNWQSQPGRGPAPRSQSDPLRGVAANEVAPSAVDIRRVGAIRVTARPSSPARFVR